MISSWVTKAIEQMRVMKKFPSDLSLASTSSTHSTSGWSNSGSIRVGNSGGGGTMGGAGPSGSSIGSSQQRMSLSGLSHSTGVEFMETQ